MTAQHLLAALFNAGIAISVGATVLSLGMTFTVGQLVAPLHRAGLVIALVVLNSVVIPAAAWGIAEVSPMGTKYVPGLVLATVGAGSAASLKAAQLAKRVDLPLAVTVVVVLQLVNIVAVPLWAGQIVTGASISAWDIVKSLLLLVLVPLVVGLFARARYADHAKAWQPELVKVANLALVVALATGIAANWSTIVSMFGSWVIVTAIVIVIVSGVLGLLPGLLLGGRSAEVRTTTGLVSVFRFASLGLIIIGAQLHADPVYLGPALTFALVDFVLPLALAVELGHRAGGRNQRPSSPAAAGSASSPPSR
ncbi:MAG: bile acid:Na+ symporter, family [Streptosporangiaceae bacterium]|nr:bile acid:Na+ symporter, family [Streptosporangiaceae bacterium]